MKKLIVGQDYFLERVMVAILAQGHLLVEGVPGLAKTLTVKDLGTDYQRRFSGASSSHPDLVPRPTLIGNRIYNQKTSEFSTDAGTDLHPPAAGGRDQPRAGQGAERPARSHARAAGNHRRRNAYLAGPLPGHWRPRTRLRLKGPTRLPEAQVDRFMMKVLVNYPTPEEEFVIAQRVTGEAPEIATIATTEQLAALQAECPPGLRRTGADAIRRAPGVRHARAGPGMVCPSSNRG